MTKKSKAEQVEEKVQDAAPAAEQAEQMEGADAARQPSEEELKAMLRTEEFSSRSQTAAYFFAHFR